MSEFEMDKFERELTHALQRVDAPEGFAARIMDRVAKPAEAPSLVAAPPAAARGKVLAFPARIQRYAAMGLAAALAIGVFGLNEVRESRERRLATQQFETATRITDHALEHTRQQLAKAGVQLDTLE